MKLDKDKKKNIFTNTCKKIKDNKTHIYEHLQENYQCLKSDSHQKKYFHLLHWKPFKNCTNCFLFCVNSSSGFWDTWIFALTFWLCKKRYEKRAKVNFKIYDMTDWYIFQYLKKLLQPDNEIWSVSRIQHEKYSIFKNHVQNVAGQLLPDPFIKIRMKHISGSIVWNIKFAFIACPSRGKIY